MVDSVGSSSLRDYLMQLGQYKSVSPSTQSSSQSSSTSSAEGLFSKIDADGNGSVSKDELSTFQSNMETQFINSVMNSRYDRAGAASSTEDLFGQIDTSSDGSISSSEFNVFLSNLGTGTAAAAAASQGADDGSSSFNIGSIATSTIMNAIGKYAQFAL